MKQWILHRALTAMFFCLLFSCRKDQLLTNPAARIQSSKDTLRFDTVFTATGSVTQSFTLLNPNDRPIRFDAIRLSGAQSSPFRINVNGIAGPELNNLELDAGDSLYIYVSVFINPGSGNLPFLVQDSIAVTYNGNQKFIQLEAFGQNAHYVRNTVISRDTSWTDNLPHVILGDMQVDTGVTLRLLQGCRLYFHADAALLVDGSLVALGEKNREVQCTGDRLDPYYRDLPGSWPGLFFRDSSRANLLRFTTIRNAYRAISVQDAITGLSPKLELQQCIIDHASDIGILNYRGSIDVNNSLIRNCGRNLVMAGGRFSFTHCTVASYAQALLDHRYPVLTVADYAILPGGLQPEPCEGSFINCIFWGSQGLVDNEVFMDRQTTAPFNLYFGHCLYRGNREPAPATLDQLIQNTDPLFDSIDVQNRYFDFHTTRANAPGQEQGAATALLKDLDDLDRTVGLPDLGCYEKP